MKLNYFKNYLTNINAKINLLYLSIFFSGVCTIYFIVLQKMNIDWSTKFKYIAYFSWFFLSFFIFSGVLFIVKSIYPKIKFNFLRNYGNLLLCPLSVCFSLSLSYALCLTIFHYNSIFESFSNFWMYSFIMLYYLVFPTTTVAHTILSFNSINYGIVKPGNLLDRF